MELAWRIRELGQDPCRCPFPVSHSPISSCRMDPNRINVNAQSSSGAELSVSLCLSNRYSKHFKRLTSVHPTMYDLVPIICRHAESMAFCLLSIGLPFSPRTAPWSYHFFNILISHGVLLQRGQGLVRVRSLSSCLRWRGPTPQGQCEQCEQCELWQQMATNGNRKPTGHQLGRLGSLNVSGSQVSIYF